jgi:Tfp pilus assembly protein PilF
MMMHGRLLRFFRPAVRCSALMIVAALLLAAPARAETVEVAPGVRVTKKTYPAPANQQPFFGFAAKTPAQQAADAKFIDALVAATGSRQKAFEEASLRGWRAIGKNSAVEAAQRFNQAWLIEPGQSAVYHGFAIVAMMRFGDIDYADELFRIARKQPDPLKPLLADYGRALLLGKRPEQARAILEEAVAATPDLADAWSNLGFARVDTGDKPGACAAAEEAAKHKPSTNVLGDIALLRNRAGCN